MKKHTFFFISLIVLFMVNQSLLQAQTIASTGFTNSGSTELKNALKGAVEDVSLRTPNSSTWRTASGKIITRYSSALINYKDAQGNYQPLSQIQSPKSYWTGGSTPSCLYPNFNSDSILITIPAGIRITFFTIDYAYETNDNVPIPMSDGVFYFSTPCGAIDTIRCNNAQPGYCYLMPGSDFSNPLTTCLNATCSTQSFWLTAHLSRFQGGAGCDTSYVWYSAYNHDSIYTFSAYLIGEPIIHITNAVTAQLGPCNGGVKVTASGGTPPYTYLWDNGATTDSISSLCSGNYCCTVTDSKGCSDSTCAFVPNNPAGIHAITNSPGINIYPDPNSGIFTIEGIAPGQRIELYNCIGQKLYTIIADNSTLRVNIAGKPNGMYLIRIINPDESPALERKIIKTL